MAARLPLGLGLMGAGIFTIWGGLSGRLAPMLAAVFTPSLLEPASGGSSSSLQGIAPPRGGELIPPGTGPGTQGPPVTTQGGATVPAGAGGRGGP